MKTALRSLTLGIIGLAMLVFTYGCGGSTSLLPPTVDLTGTWFISEIITSANSVCSDTVGNTDSYTVTVVQNGNELTVVLGDDAELPSGTTFTGTISGNQINWSGSYPTAGGTTTVNNTDITANDSTMSGTANWSWSDGTDSCQGTTSVSGTRQS